MSMGADALALLPELLVFAGGLLALVSGSFLPRRRQWVAGLLALAMLGASAAAAVVGLLSEEMRVFSGTFAVDTAAGVARLVVVVATALVVALAAEELRGHPRESETYALLMFAASGVLVLAGASDLMVLIVGFLLASIPLYGLIGVLRLPRSAEAALKTYLMGALFGIVLMLGVTLLFGLAGTTTYAGLAEGLDAAPRVAVAAAVVLVLGGLMFEAGAVPAHFWVPDATQGTSVTAATFLTTVPKVGALVATYRLVVSLPDDLGWPLLVAGIATLSMTLGNLAAYAQTDPRRLLGWSTVSQAGFLLVPVAVAGNSDLALPSLLLYLAGYAVTNICAFAVTAALPQRRALTDYRGLSRSRPWLTGSLLVALLGLLGTPPTVVFVGKLTTATAAWDGGLAWLAVVVVLNTLVSLFYYLRWVVEMFRPAPAETTSAPPRVGRLSAQSVAVSTATASVALGLGAGALWPVLDGVLLR